MIVVVVSKEDGIENQVMLFQVVHDRIGVTRIYSCDGGAALTTDKPYIIILKGGDAMDFPRDIINHERILTGCRIEVKWLI
jgi:hypothetical protein